MIRLDLVNVGQVEETDAILLVLRAPERGQLLVIETGILEGQAIALEAQRLRTERPMTHDLLSNVIQGLGARVEEVRIHEFKEETFFAEVVLTRTVDGGRRVSFDSRPSDAIALALRAGAPIYVADHVMDETGIPEEIHGRFSALFDDAERENAGTPPGGGRIVH